MILLFLHGDGWDEFVLLGVAILVAFVIVRLSTRGSNDDPEDTPTA